jgi:hypothetical protein
MPEYTRKQDIDNTRDKLASGPVTPGDYGISSSSNLTVDTDGAYDDPKEFFPHNNSISSGKKRSPEVDNFFDGEWSNLL